MAGPMLLVLTLVISSVVGAPGFTFEMPADLQLIDQRQLGIFHYELAGHIATSNDSRYVHSIACSWPRTPLLTCSASVPIKMRRKAYSGSLHFFLRGVPHLVNGEYQGMQGRHTVYTATRPIQASTSAALSCLWTPPRPTCGTASSMSSRHSSSILHLACLCVTPLATKSTYADSMSAMFSAAQLMLPPLTPSQPGHGDQGP